MNDIQQRKREWPALKSAQEVTCYGRNPHNDDPCILGQHQGPHRDDAGAEWLDDGDLARPDWLDEPYDPRD